MASVRDVLKGRVERLRTKKAHAQAQLDAVQADLDAARAALDMLTTEHDALLATLSMIGVVKTED